MGNFRFRLSDMIPNAWFYKLRDMSKPKSHTPHSKPSTSYPSSTATTSKPHHHFSHPRNSFYYTPRADHFHNPNISHFPHDPPRKSSKKSRPNSRKTIYKPSSKHARPAELTRPDQDSFFSPTSTVCSHEDPKSPWSAESTQSFNRLASASASCSCRVSSSTSDIIIDVNDKSFATKIGNSNGFDLVPELELLQLPPIITKPSRSVTETQSQTSASIKIVKENTAKKETPGRRSVSGVKLRANSPRIAVNKRISQANSHKSSKSQKNYSNKKNLSESFAIVKSSFDPQKDFMESMMEMITENNIRSSKDLEDLLACYLSLNSDEYHDLIVKAFEQIWFTLPDL